MLSVAQEEEPMIELTTVAVLLGLALYAAPTCIGIVRRKRNLAGICIVNLLLGWTVVGWVGALVWASLSEESAI